MRPSSFIIAGILVAVPALAHAQAFGTWAGMKPTDFPSAEYREENRFKVTPPEPSEIATDYSATFSDTQGICQITAFTEDMSPSEAGRMRGDLMTLLNERYGKVQPLNWKDRGLGYWVSDLSDNQDAQLGWDEPSGTDLRSIFLIEYNDGSYGDHYLQLTYTYVSRLSCTDFTVPAPKINSKGL